MSKRILTVFVLVGSLVLPGLGLGSAHAYPPRDKLSVKFSQIFIKPETGKTILTISNACPGAVKVLKGTSFYTKLNASQGFGKVLFGNVPSGKYKVTVQSCSEAVSQLVYAPSFSAPPSAKISKTNTFTVKYVPQKTSIVLFINGKKYGSQPMPSSGTALFNVKKKTLKLKKNVLSLTVGVSRGQKVILTDTIIGTK